MNPAEKAQNRAESVIEKRLRKVYGEARDEMRKRLAKFESRTKALELGMLKKLEKGEITEDELKRWRQYRVFRGENWQSQIDAMTQTLEQSNRVALQIVNGKTSEIFAAGRNYEAYTIESDIGAMLGKSFEIYDEAAVARLLREQPELLPRRKKLNGQKDRAWNKGNISSVVTSSILKGDGIPDIAKALSDKLAITNMAAMTRYARTAMTGAQNAGRVEAMHTAQDMGIRIKKKWLATLDRRTRDSHQEMDGVVVDVDKEFPNGLMYPGDPDGNPAEVYNCRCTLISVYPDYPSANGKRRDGDGNVLGEMTYTEWEKAKKGVAPFRMGEEMPRPEVKTTAKAEKPKTGVEGYVKAKTIAEAEEYAETFMDTEMWASWGISYDGVEVSTANVVNYNIAKFLKTYNVKPISGILAPKGNTTLGRKIQDASAAFNTMNRGILLNRKSVKNPLMYKKAQIKERQLIKDFLANPSKYNVSKSTRKIIEASAKSGRGSVPENLTDVINHELGHALQNAVQNAENFGKIEAEWAEWGERISGYATTSIHEYIAESFCAMNKGETIAPELAKAFKALMR